MQEPGETGTRGLGSGADQLLETATELLVGPVYFRFMFGGRLDLAFAERVVDEVMRGWAAPASSAQG